MSYKYGGFKKRNWKNVAKRRGDLTPSSSNTPPHVLCVDPVRGQQPFHTHGNTREITEHVSRRRR